MDKNLGFVAFSPMDNGFLSGKYTPSDKFQGDDVRRVITRFSPENMKANQPLLNLGASLCGAERMHGGTNQPRVGVERRRFHRAHPRNAQREPHHGKPRRGGHQID